MPYLIKTIDQIAREKQRDVLFLDFPEVQESETFFDYEQCEARKLVINWLEKNNIHFYPCGYVASENGFASSDGRLYLDVVFDVNDETYKILSNFLENPDGTMKIPGVRFCYLPLKMAMKNAHHDEPGFWGKWAEDF